ncbi:hypothetical protein [Pantoea ananatis]|uniref:hypothetical protein n=1 Tax=Pantoea ananas TaxID=553 RepID=UPI001B30C335|nr:hypothetical protein [Pantoea ananatis]
MSSQAAGRASRHFILVTFSEPCWTIPVQQALTTQEKENENNSSKKPQRRKDQRHRMDLQGLPRTLLRQLLPCKREKNGVLKKRP